MQKNKKPKKNKQPKPAPDFDDCDGEITAEQSNQKEFFELLSEDERREAFLQMVRKIGKNGG